MGCGGRYINLEQYKLARLEGFEPTTLGSEDED
jgi:hypothetical protein